MRKASKQVLNDAHPLRITGVMMQYVVICERELWFETQGIQIDKENPHIVKGSSVDKNSYDYLKRETVHLGPIAPDMLQSGKVVEIKPSSKLEEASRSQLLYYLWYLKHKFGMKREGVLAYPTERTRESVTLTKEAEEKVENRISRVKTILNKNKPPKYEEKTVCENCAFEDFCKIGVQQ